MPSSNPRYRNYTARDTLRKRVRAMGLPCAICGKPIDYSLNFYTDPNTGKKRPHPMRYELDEIVPISKGGSPTDPNNVQPVHRFCNQLKGNGETKKYKALLRTRAASLKREHSQEW